MIDNHVENVKTAGETLVALGAISAPMWLDVAETFLHLAMGTGGFILLVLTIIYRWKAIKLLDKKGHDDEMGV